MESFTFYELYADILQGLDNASAGKFARKICAYEFENVEPSGEMTDKESFYWSNIADMLSEVKGIESEGRIPKKYNLRSKHFTFYESYYKAMKLLNDRQCGAFVKAICEYMWDDKDPDFADKSMRSYFNLCKRNMDISKKRKSVGKAGGTARKAKTKAGVEQKKQPVRPMTFAEFMAKHPDISGYFSGKGEEERDSIDWSDLDAKLEEDAELAEEHNVYYLAKMYLQKYAKKGKQK